ncbi:MAG: S-adenosylmethionine hydrolase [Flavobacteriales bacterium]|jgi:S-adenosylmethionine hydrolase
MAVITLISDMGTSDYYVAAIKGTILSSNPNAIIVDITHEVPPFNISYAGFTLKHCFKDFPLGTVHIIGVLPESDEQTNHIAVSYEGHFFIGADNGLFSLIFDREPDHIVVLNNMNQTHSQSFPTKTIFAQAATFLSLGKPIEELGVSTMDYRRTFGLLPTATEDLLKGSVIHIDRYGNLISNITRQEFDNQQKGRPFRIVFGKSGYNITQISKQYNDVGEAKAVAIFSENGLLEIAINKGAKGHGGGASQLFGMKTYDVIRIEFDDR